MIFLLKGIFVVYRKPEVWAPHVLRCFETLFLFLEIRSSSSSDPCRWERGAWMSVHRPPDTPANPPVVVLFSVVLCRSNGTDQGINWDWTLTRFLCYCSHHQQLTTVWPLPPVGRLITRCKLFQVYRLCALCPIETAVTISSGFKMYKEKKSKQMWIDCGHFSVLRG